ncbi:14454_t:CDS:2 [Entrophospora sp. SA101]|nr:14454_t:CDS:2 [Entrophospora sp. SA101]
MFSTTNLNNNIKIQLFIFCLFFGYVSTEKPQTNNPDPDSTVSSFLSKVVQLPQISIVNGELIFSCPSTDSYSNLEEYTSFFSQVGTFIPITGLLFTIAVYGTKSIFGIMTTCFLDDIVIFTSSFGAIFWWYTFAKPFWLTAVTRAMEMDSNYDYSRMYSTVFKILIGSAIFVLALMAIIRFHFHKRRNQLDEDSLWFKAFPKNCHLNNKQFFSHLKAYVIWVFFLHSIEIIAYSIFSYRHIFSAIFKRFEQVNADKGLNFVVYTKQINLLFLNYFMNFCYFLAALCLVVTYHIPKWEKYLLCITSKNRRYRGFVRKKVFFFTVTLCILHVFFEYYWFCTDPFFSTVFNTLLVTVLTRSIASFFTDNGVIECTYKHGDDEKVFSEIKAGNINEVVYFYKNDKMDKNDKTEPDKWISLFKRQTEQEKAEKAKKEKEKLEKAKKFEYFYVTIDEKWVHFYKLDYKYDEEEQLKNASTLKRYILIAKKYFFGKIVFESEPILREVRKMTKADKNCPLEHHNCEQIKGFMKDIEHGLRYNKSGEPKKNSFFRNSLLKMNNKVDVKKTEVENTEEPKKNTEVKVKKVQVKRMEAEDKVLINILETGFLNYFIYSHRKDRDGSYDEYGNYDENEYKYEFEISEVHKKC